MMIICTLNFNNNVIIPIYAQEVLGRGAQGYANLLSATGIGSLIAAFLMSYLAWFWPTPRFIPSSGIRDGLGSIADDFVHALLVGDDFMVVIGFLQHGFLESINAAFRSLSPMSCVAGS